MALIPQEVGIRMRMQTEANLLQPVAPLHEIPSDLPELQPGQTFHARIQQVLPDNTYQALVAGKQLTLQLPEGAKPGDLLELMVIDRSAKVIIAQQVTTASPEASGEEATAYPYARLSPAARLIGELLPAEGEKLEPLPLNRGQPLLAEPPTRNAALRLAPLLANAVSQSGLFYEAHQALWVNGKLPLERLLQEPQGRYSSPTLLARAAAADASQAEGHEAAQPVPGVVQNQQAAGAKAGVGEAAPTASSQTSTAAVPTRQVPDELRPIVQHQLEAVATQRMFWHGEIWPQQSIDWEIEWDGERAADGRSDEEERWRTALSLTTPRLGRIDASLQLSREGVRITLGTTSAESAAELRDASSQLASALEAAGVPLIGFQVRQTPPAPLGA